MQFVADLHLHGKYSRAVSQQMVLSEMSKWAKKKGLDILSTTDWTHPLWFREINAFLEEAEEGLYRLKEGEEKTLFILTTEISSIYSQGGKVRRIHNLIFSPSIETCGKINKELVRRNCNLISDGRPIIGLSSKELYELILSIDEKCILVPCHVWTPWFSLYGSNSGFDSTEECFGEYSKYIYAVETGLSSDPQMNWRINELDNRSILSSSDAHSPAKMGREATVFELERPSYENIVKAIKQLSVFGSQLSDNGRPVVGQSETDKQKTEKQESDLACRQAGNRKQKTDNRILYTIEFYPEEGKYHYTGHRNCKVVQSPEETKAKGVICPACRRPLTVGVMHRVEQLGKEVLQEELIKVKNNDLGVKWIGDPRKIHPPYVKLVPLLEILAESSSSTVTSIKSKETYENLCFTFGSELNILLRMPLLDIEKKAGAKIAEGIKKVRSGDIVVNPGFDGEYGKVKIWAQEENQDKSLGEQIVKKKKTPQLTLEF